MKIITAPLVAGIAIGGLLAQIRPPSAQPAPQSTAQDQVTNQVAMELGRLIIENRTLNVSVDVLRGRIAELEKQLKECGPQPETRPDQKP